MPIEELMRKRSPLLVGFTHKDVNPLKPELEAAFKRFAEPVGGYRMPDALVTDRVIGGPHGAIPIRVYAPPTRSDPGPGLVWLHGGAFAGKDLDRPKANYAARELNRRADVAVVSVDYRVARDGVGVPVPHGDVMAAVRWAVAADDKLQIEWVGWHSANELTLSFLADAITWCQEVA